MNRRRKSGVAGSSTSVVLKNEEDGHVGKESGMSRMTASVTAHNTRTTVPPFSASRLRPWYSIAPIAVTSDTEMNGITVICRSLMKMSPTTWSQPTMSPKRTPATTPRPSPIRTRLANESRRFLGADSSFTCASRGGSAMGSFGFRFNVVLHAAGDHGVDPPRSE